MSNVVKYEIVDRRGAEKQYIDNMARLNRAHSQCGRKT